MGVVGAGLLQVLLPAVLVLPGLVAFARLGPHDICAVTPDRTWLRLVDTVFATDGFLGPLGRGLAVSAVVAAAMCVVGSVLNAAATLWSIDIAQDMLLRPVSEADMIRRGRWSSLAALLIGVAATPLLLWWKQGLLVYIEEVAAVVTPPLAVVLLAAFFWPRAHGRAATFTLLLGIAAGGLLWVATVDAAGAAGLVLGPFDPRRPQRRSLPAGLGGGNVPHSAKRLRTLRRRTRRGVSGGAACLPASNRRPALWATWRFGGGRCWWR